MEQRKLGDLTVSAIGLGCMSMSPCVDARVDARVHARHQTWRAHARSRPR